MSGEGPRGRRNAPRIAARLAGEFTVIVIGVLVALGVDGWRQEREEQRILEESLQAIAEQVRGLHYTYGRIIEAKLPDKIASLERLIGFLEVENAPVQDTLLLLTDITTAAAAVELWLSTDRYESTRSSGHLRLLRNTELAADLAGAHAGVDVLLKQVYRLDGDFRHVALQLLPPTYASRVSPLRSYADTQDRERVDAAAPPPSGLDRFVEDVRDARAELLPLARAELVATEARRFAFLRIRENFQRVLVVLDPWAREPLGDFELGRSPPERPGFTADFRSSTEVPREALGSTYAEGKWRGSADFDGSR